MDLIKYMIEMNLMKKEIVKYGGQTWTYYRQEFVGNLVYIAQIRMRCDQGSEM